MTESEFEDLAGAALAALESAFEAGAPDADVQTKGAGVLEIERARSGWRQNRADSISATMARSGATRETAANCLPRFPGSPRSRAASRWC